MFFIFMHCIFSQFVLHIVLLLSKVSGSFLCTPLLETFLGMRDRMGKYIYDYII